jgi:hypothetical protein
MADDTTAMVDRGPQPTSSDAGNTIDAGPSTSGQSPVPVQPAPVAQPAPVQAQPAPQVQVPPAVPPHAQKASMLHDIAEVLAGGPTYKTTINAETGAATREKVPVSGKHLGLAIALEALGGAIGGLKERGPNAAGQAAANQFAVGQQQAQQRQQAQAQQANEDFERVQKQKVRQQQTLAANMEAMRTAYAVGKEDEESKQKAVDNHSSELESWKNNGAIEDSKVPSNELMKRGFDPSKYIAVPDGTVPVIGQDGQQAKDANGVPLTQLTYSVVDGTTQAPLTQQTFDKFQSYGLQKQSRDKDGKPIQIPEGATISSATLAQMNHKVDMIDQTQREVDEIAGAGKIDIKQKIKENPALINAIEAFHNDAASDSPDVQLKNLQAKNPNAAALMASVFGKSMEEMKADRAAKESAEKVKQDAQVRAEVEAGTPKGQQQLKNEKLTQQEKELQILKLKKEGGVDLSKINTTAEGLEGVRFNPQDPNYKVNQGVLQQLDQQDAGLAATVRALGEGREIMTPQAQRTKDGQAIMNAVNLAYPNYNAAKVETYHKGRQVGTGGTLGNKVNSFATAMDHLQRYYDNISAISATGGVSSIAALLGNEKAKALQTDRTALASEIASAYKGGVPSKEEIDKWENSLSGGTPMAARNGAVETAKLLHGKFSEYANQYRNMIPGGLRDDNFQLMSNTAANAYQHVTGQPIGNTQPFTQGQQTPQQQQKVVPAGAHPVTVNGQVTGYVVNGAYKAF